MTTTSIKKQLNEYLPLLTAKQQELLLEMVKNILQVEPVSKRLSLKQYNQELAKSIEQAKSGKTIKHNDVLKEFNKW